MVFVWKKLFDMKQCMTHLMYRKYLMAFPQSIHKTLFHGNKYLQLNVHTKHANLV